MIELVSWWIGMLFHFLMNLFLFRRNADWLTDLITRDLNKQTRSIPFPFPFTGIYILGKHSIPLYLIFENG